MSFYRSKMILDCPNCFGKVQIVLVRSKLFWSGPNHFGQFQIRLFWTSFYNLNLSKMISKLPKQIGPVQNDLYSTKMIWTVQNHFGPIEGQSRNFIHTLGPNLINLGWKTTKWIHHLSTWLQGVNIELVSKLDTNSMWISFKFLQISNNA